MSTPGPGPGPATTVSDPAVLTEVPASLQQLVRRITRGFYGTTAAIIVDLLVRHPCVKEDDLLELLHFERKQLRMVVGTLRADKLLKARMRVETDSDGRMTRHNYYFINYSVFVNVVKFKLDHMRRRIEVDERESTSRASFICPRCDKAFTDLDAAQLFDASTLSFLCTYCGSEVTEETAAPPATQARSLMVKFNEQIEPIFALLLDLEDVRLSQDILEPQPTDVFNKHKSAHSGSKNGGDRGVWSGDASKGIDYGYTENQVTINMGGDKEEVKSEKAKKARPVWMVESTIAGADSRDNQADVQKVAVKRSATVPGAVRNADGDDIMKTLLAHEKKASAPNMQASGLTAVSDEESSTSEEEEEATAMKPVAGLSEAAVIEEMESDDEMEETVAMVTVNHVSVPYDEVTEEMVSRMTTEEKDAYIALGQKMYDDMYN